MKKQYTVCFLFSPGGDRVLMVEKLHTVFKGRLNGVGGKIEPAESARDGALREIREETGLSIAPDRLLYLGFTSLPDDCADEPSEQGCTLFFYAVELTSLETNNVPAANDVGERLVWESTDMVRTAPANSVRYAGDGDVPCWVNIAASKLGFPQPKPMPCSRYYYLLRDSQGIMDMVCSDMDPDSFRKSVNAIRQEYLEDCDENHVRLYHLLLTQGCTVSVIPYTDIEV